MSRAISHREAKRLSALEKTVAKGKRAFIEVGNALKEIRDSGLYKATHKTFAAYVEDRLSLKRRYAYDLIESASVVESVRNCAQINNEGQAREVAKAPPEQQQAVVDRAAEIAEEQGKKPTAAIISQARKEVVGEVVPDDSPDTEEWEDVDDDAEDEKVT